MVGAPSFSQPYLCIQLPWQSPPKTCSSSFVNFHLPISPLLHHKISFTIPNNTSFLSSSAIFHLLIFGYNPFKNQRRKFFLCFSQLADSDAARDQVARESCKGRHCFKLYLLPQSMDSNNRAQNHWFFITHPQNNGAFQVVVSNYSRYFLTLLIPLKIFTFLWKPVS